MDLVFLFAFALGFLGRAIDRYAAADRLDTTVAIPAFVNLTDIIHGLRATHIAVFDYGIVVVFRFAQSQHIRLHLAPMDCILAMLAG